MKLSPPRTKLAFAIKPPRLNLDKLNVAAGALILWIAVGPWVWGYAGSGSAVASHVFFIVVFGPLSLLLVALPPAAPVTPSRPVEAAGSRS